MHAYRGVGNFRVHQSTPGFIGEVILDKRVSVEQAVALSDKMKKTSRLSNITRDHQFSFDEVDIRAYYGSDTIKSGGFSSAAKAGFKVTAIVAIVEILRQVGIVGDVLSFGVTVAQAAELRSKNDVQSANRLWASYIFETAGGLTGGALGAFFATAILKGYGGLWGPIIGAVAGGVGASYAGAELGGYLYDLNNKIFDSYINPIYDQLSELNPFDDGETSDDYVKKIAASFGFDFETGTGGSGDDWLLATKWSHLNGSGGNDILIGWDPKFVNAGSPVDPANKESPVAPKDLSMVIDGGSGKDLVVTIGGKRATTAGGIGRDWIYNRSYGGEIYGDTIDRLDPATGKTIETMPPTATTSGTRPILSSRTPSTTTSSSSTASPSPAATPKAASSGSP